MANNKWVEVEARSIDDAIKAGLNELNLEDATQANINILREPEGGVFGVGGTKALVRVSVRNGGSRNYTNKRRNNNRNNNTKNSNRLAEVIAQKLPKNFPTICPKPQRKNTCYRGQHFSVIRDFNPI